VKSLEAQLVSVQQDRDVQATAAQEASKVRLMNYFIWHSTQQNTDYSRGSVVEHFPHEREELGQYS